MNIHDATEISFKNGYKAGVEAVKKELENKLYRIPQHHFTLEDVLWYVDKIAKELVGEKE